MTITLKQLRAAHCHTLAKATKAVGIKPCGGCKKRQAKLNKLVPYKKRHR